ncbi:hypothetical protein [Nocardia nova]|uniref:hypothetical protein n=1 Tax=Nocardia nova TaxID=37330 RepID=UPI0011AFE0E9|nr:hypothetical protein [Nocardia nova]
MGAQEPSTGWGQRRAQGSGHRGHGAMMIACCALIIAIALVLVVTGVMPSGFLLVALGCTLMTAVMMADVGHPGRN